MFVQQYFHKQHVCSSSSLSIIAQLSTGVSIHSIPKPSEFEIAIVNFFFNCCLVLYFGRQSWLKQVCAIGNLNMIDVSCYLIHRSMYDWCFSTANWCSKITNDEINKSKKIKSLHFFANVNRPRNLEIHFQHSTDWNTIASCTES